MIKSLASLGNLHPSKPGILDSAAVGKVEEAAGSRYSYVMLCLKSHAQTLTLPELWAWPLGGGVTADCS